MPESLTDKELPEMKKITYLRVALIAPLLALASLISAFTVLPVKAAPVSGASTAVYSQRSHHSED